MADGTDTTVAEAYPNSWERPTVFYHKSIKYVFYAIILLFIIWSAWEMRVSWERLSAGIDGASRLVSGMWPPDTTPIGLSRVWHGMIESIAMAIVATIIGVIVSTPIAVMGARNLLPSWIYLIGRGIISVSRGLHELVLGIIMVVAVGFGPLAGVLALIFATPGFFSKLLAEDLEDIDEGQVKAIRATGASPMSVLLFGVAPQVIPRFVGLSIYRWDINIRAAAIIGIVGAGGIGQTLLTAFDNYDYDLAASIIIAIIAVVMVGELTSAWWRKRVS